MLLKIKVTLMHFSRSTAYDCEQSILTVMGVGSIFSSVVLAQVFVKRSALVTWNATLSWVSGHLSKADFLTNEEKAYFKEDRDLRWNRVRVVSPARLWKPALVSVALMVSGLFLTHLAKSFEEECKLG